MNNTIAAVTKVAQRYYGQGLRFVTKYSPEILTGVGILGGIAAGVMGAKATLKLDKLVAELELNLEQHKQLRYHTTEETYTRVAYIRDITGDYAVATAKIAQLYAPTIGLTVASAACLLGSQGIMKRRTVVLATAYEALERVYNGYRQRVIEEFGEDKDRDFRFGITDGKVHVRTDDETLEKHRITEATFDPTVPSMYARVFDEISPNWDKRPEHNLTFLNAQQRFANQRLHAYGYLFLNDVYDMLGLPRTAAGQVVGWLDNTKNDDELGDCFVDFGIYKLDDTKSREFVNGASKYILLDFNVDGMIWDKF